MFGRSNGWHKNCVYTYGMRFPPELKFLVRRLAAIEGYLSLGLAQEALEEIQELPEETRHHPKILRLHIICLLMQGSGHYREALRLSRRGIRDYPEFADFYFLKASALEQLCEYAEAKKALLQSPTAFHGTEAYHFHLARYELDLGNRAEARQHLHEAISINSEVEDVARLDPRLKQLLEN
jgi:tetratricopeptide (TPR) repeat protein